MQKMNSAEPNINGTNEAIYCDLCGYVRMDNLCEHVTLIVEPDDTVQEPGTATITFEELLISLVEVRSPLWNTRLPIVQRTKGIREKLWLEIYEHLDRKYSIEMLQKKWRNLRDTYIKTKADIEVYTPSGSAAKKEKRKWKHFDILTFLSETVAPRTTTSSLNIEQVPQSSLSPSFCSEESEPPRKKPSSKVEDALINAIKSIPPPQILPERQLNPICIKICHILETLDPRKRAMLEVDLLKRTYEVAFPDIQF